MESPDTGDPDAETPIHSTFAKRPRADRCRLSVVAGCGFAGATLFAALMSFFRVWRARSEMDQGAKLFFIIAITVGAITVSAVEQQKPTVATLSVIG